VRKSSVKPPLAAVAYEKIYRRIMTLAYAPGHYLEEKQLMDELGIGRTPIREALLRLTADFMVESQPSKGAVVRPITLQGTKAVFAALKILELGAAELAVRQDVSAFLPHMGQANEAVITAIEKKDVVGLVEANSQFHKVFSQCSRNDYIIHGLAKVRCETNRLAYLSFSNEIDPLKTLQDHYGTVVDQHNRIVDLLRQRKGNQLKTTLSDHTKAFQERIILYAVS
jgi:DNA-binding GntR family transcriptional regulator